MLHLYCSYRAIKTSRSLSSIYWETYRLISPGVKLFFWQSRSTSSVSTIGGAKGTPSVGFVPHTTLVYETVRSAVRPLGLLLALEPSPRVPAWAISTRHMAAIDKAVVAYTRSSSARTVSSGCLCACVKTISAFLLSYALSVSTLVLN